MKPINVDFKNTERFVSQAYIRNRIDANKPLIQNVLAGKEGSPDVLGWLDLDEIGNAALLNEINEKAKEIRENADIFVLIGVGGSNQGSRAVIKALGDNKPEILYAGNNLSPRYLNNLLSQLKGNSVYINVIAKNFATLEPGITFRILRHYLEETYGEAEAAKRIIATGSLNGSSLELLAKQKGYMTLPFPLAVGGRFSVLSAVGLFPIAVSGVDISALLQGAKDMKALLQTAEPAQNPAVIYAAARNILLEKGYCVEILAAFEPALEFFAKWWVQLFGESEGKDGKGIFPTSCMFSEDLHSLGQYIQEGRRMLFETFVNIENMGDSLPIPTEAGDADGFAYLNGSDFRTLNSVAFAATVKAHSDGGVPCVVVNVPQLDAYYFGQLFFFFEYSCYISGRLLGVDPFDQPGVEAYKNEMFKELKK